MTERRTTIAAELASGATVTYYTLGTSMRPLLRERETHVTLVSAAGREPRVGDIVLYLRHGAAGEQYVLHRLIRRQGDLCLMRGDNTFDTEPVPRARVIGVVTHIYRHGRLFSVTESRPYRLYARLWQVGYPLRRLLWRVRRLLTHHVIEKKGN